MEQIEITNKIADSAILLSYMANFSLTFVIAIVGAFTKEVYNYKKNTIKISLLRVLASALICSVVMTAVVEYILDIPFGVFVLISFFFGMWAFSIIEMIMNAKYSAIVIKDILKELKNPLLKGTANAIEDIRKEMKEEKKEKDKKDQEAKKNEPPKEEKKEEKVEEESLTQEEEDKIVTSELLEQIRKLEARIAEQVEAEEKSSRKKKSS